MSATFTSHPKPKGCRGKVSEIWMAAAVVVAAAVGVGGPQVVAQFNNNPVQA